MRELMRIAHARESNGSSPEVVAAAVHHALRARRPRRRYLVGADARKLAALPWLLPQSVLDQVRLRALGMPTEFGSEPAQAAPRPPAGAR
jgi:hypothetical protein